MLCGYKLQRIQHLDARDVTAHGFSDLVPIVVTLNPPTGAGALHNAGDGRAHNDLPVNGRQRKNSNAATNVAAQRPHVEPVSGRNHAWRTGRIPL